MSQPIENRRFSGKSCIEYVAAHQSVTPEAACSQLKDLLKAGRLWATGPDPESGKEVTIQPSWWQLWDNYSNIHPDGSIKCRADPPVRLPWFIIHAAKFLELFPPHPAKEDKTAWEIAKKKQEQAETLTRQYRAEAAARAKQQHARDNLLKPKMARWLALGAPILIANQQARYEQTIEIQRMRNIANMTLDQIGQKFLISKEHVRKICLQKIFKTPPITKWLRSGEIHDLRKLATRPDNQTRPANPADDVVKACRILRAILHADERGQGVNFSEAMDEAKAFCRDIEARYSLAK